MEEGNWQERVLALILLCGMLYVIFRVLRDFGKQGLSISQGKADDMQTITELDEVEEEEEDHQD